MNLWSSFRVLWVQHSFWLISALEGYKCIMTKKAPSKRACNGLWELFFHLLFFPRIGGLTQLELIYVSTWTQNITYYIYIYLYIWFEYLILCGRKKFMKDFRNSSFTRKVNSSIYYPNICLDRRGHYELMRRMWCSLRNLISLSRTHVKWF